MSGKVRTSPAGTLSRQDVACRFCVTRRTVSDWVRSGTIPQPQRLLVSTRFGHWWNAADLEALERKRFNGQTYAELRQFWEGQSAEGKGRELIRQKKAESQPGVMPKDFPAELIRRGFSWKRTKAGGLFDGIELASSGAEDWRNDR